MKYISIDLEFSGLNLDYAQILEIGAIIEDTETKLPYEKCPKFHCYINHKKLTGEIYALAMNAEILKIIAKIQDIDNQVEKDKYIKENNILNDYEVTEKFFEFVYLNGLSSIDFNTAGYIKVVDKHIIPPINAKMSKTELILAGKNLMSKDIPLLKTLPRWNDVFLMSHRNIDPVNYYIDWKNDKKLPSLSICKKRANLPEKVSHKALDDAWDVISLLRPQY